MDLNTFHYAENKYNFCTKYIQNVNTNGKSSILHTHANEDDREKKNSMRKYFIHHRNVAVCCLNFIDCFFFQFEFDN